MENTGNFFKFKPKQARMLGSNFATEIPSHKSPWTSVT